MTATGCACQFRAPSEWPESTQLSRSRRVLRTAGRGHQERFPAAMLGGGCEFRKETIILCTAAGRRTDSGPLPRRRTVIRPYGAIALLEAAACDTRVCGKAAVSVHFISPIASRRPDTNRSRSSGLRHGRSAGTTTDVSARRRSTVCRASSTCPIWA